MNELEELKLKRKEFVSYALTKDCGDDYWNDIYKIDERIKKLEKRSNICSRKTKRKPHLKNIIK